jgi:hypothetical protein
VTNNNDRLWDEKETAKYLGCSVALLRRWRLLGVGVHYVKLGRLVKYRPEDIHGFVAANMRVIAA